MFNGSPPILTDGLIFYLDAANERSYISGSSFWNDLSENKYIGTQISGVGYTSQNLGSRVFLGTTGSYIDYGNILNVTSNFTITAWLMKTTSSIGFNSLVQKWEDNPSINERQWLLALTDNKPIFYVSMNGSISLNVSSSNTISQNIWYNLTAKYDGTNMYMYVNGIHDQRKAQTGSLYTSSFSSVKIGGYQYSPAPRYFFGRIANISVYNKSLSDSEILYNYNSLKGRYI